MRFSRPLLMPPHVPVAFPVRCAPRSRSYLCRRTARALIPRTQRLGDRDERTSMHLGDSRGQAFAAGLTRHIRACVPPLVAQLFQPRSAEGGRCLPAESTGSGTSLISQQRPSSG